ESHAASFALLVYASCWFKTFYPDVFCAAILNSQPMGFYQPAQLVRDARDHGVEIREVDVNFSDWDCALEESTLDPARILGRHAEMRGVIRTDRAVRLGFRQIKGLSQDRMKLFVERRGSGYATVRDVWLR
ncbi:MAG: error-prone DNA polymerase, partial [Mesorhizobium sp.]